MSLGTVQRRLLKPKLPGRIALKVPLLGTATLKMWQNFAFCHRIWHVTKGSKKWHNSHWSDETKTNLFENDAQRNVRHPKFLEMQINFSKKTVKHGGSNIMICGCCVWNGGCPKFQVGCNMDRFFNKDLLENAWTKDGMLLVWKFQLDNDQKHSSQYVKE